MPLATILSIIQFLIGVFILSIPAFVLVIIGSALHSKVSKFLRLSWIKATVLSTFIISFMILALLYTLPIIPALDNANFDLPAEFQTEIVETLEGDLQEVPALHFTIFDAAFTWITSFFKLLLAAVILAILLTPLALIGDVVFEKVRKGKSKAKSTGEAKNQKATFSTSLTRHFAGLFAASFAGTLIVAVLLVLFPWLFSSLAYFVFLS